MIKFEVNEEEGTITFGNLVSKKGNYLGIRSWKVKGFKKDKHLLDFSKAVLGESKFNTLAYEANRYADSHKLITKVEEETEGISFDDIFSPYPVLEKVAFDKSNFGQLYKKTLYTLIAKEFGCSLKVAFNTFAKIEWKYKILPYKDLIDKYARGLGGRVHSGKYRNLMKRKEDIIQAKKDGIENITPMILNFDLPPKEIKKTLGKGLWKNLCKNSFSRNKLIMESNNAYFIKPINEHLTTVNSLPSTLLKNKVYPESPTCLAALDLLRKELPLYKITPNSLHSLVNTMRDTKRMAQNLGVILVKSHKWSAEEWREKHLELVKDTNAQKYSTKYIKCLDDVPVKEDKYKGYSAKLLTSAYDIYLEGHHMHHCVASYSGKVTEGKYLVYSILDSTGKRYSTLGLNRQSTDAGEFYIFNQHYMFADKSVDDEKAKQFAKIIVNKLNSPKAHRVPVSFTIE